MKLDFYLLLHFVYFEIQGEVVVNLLAARKERHHLHFAAYFDSDQVDFDWARY